MDQRPKNKVQQIPICFRYTRVLNFEGTSRELLLKATNKNHTFSLFLNFGFFLLNFILNTKLQLLRFMLNTFQGLSNLQKRSVKALHRICLAKALTTIFRFLFSLFTLVTVPAPNWADAPTSKKYVIVQYNPYQMH